MTNEEKAQELGSVHARQYHHNTYPEHSHNAGFVFSNKEIEAACNEMAEWKDQQYAKILTKLIVELDELKHQIKSLLP